MIYDEEVMQIALVAAPIYAQGLRQIHEAGVTSEPLALRRHDARCLAYDQAQSLLQSIDGAIHGPAPGQEGTPQ